MSRDESLSLGDMEPHFSPDKHIEETHVCTRVHTHTHGTHSQRQRQRQRARLFFASLSLSLSLDTPRWEKHRTGDGIEEKEDIVIEKDLKVFFSK